MKKILLLIMLTINVLLTQAQTKDTIIFVKIPKKDKTNVNNLTQYVCQKASNDRERVLNIFYWVTHNIKRDVESYNKDKITDERKPKDILKSGEADSDGYATLIEAMCKSMDIKSQIIVGYEKNELYENGAGFYKPNHNWNAVLIDKEWEIMDAYNASGDYYMDLGKVKEQRQKMNQSKLFTSTKLKFKYNYKPEYLFQNPLEVRLTRVPLDPIWQLTDTALPITIFEKKENDIIEFNRKYKKLNKGNTALTEINELEEDDQVLECATRTRKFNPRYTIMEARKHLALAKKDLAKINKHTEIGEAKGLASTAKSNISTSKEILGDHKKNITQEYSELREANNNKKTDVIQYKQNFTTPNTKFIAATKSRIASGKNIFNSLKNDLKNKEKNKTDKSKNSFDLVKTIKPERPTNSIELIKLSDSVENRTKRQEILSNSIIELKANQEVLEEVIDDQIDSLYFYIRKTDSTLQKEAVVRSNKKDIYDDSLKKIRSNILLYKESYANIIQLEVIDFYDSIIANHNTLKKQHSKLIELCKSNMKDIETYKHFNSSNTKLENDYYTNQSTSSEAAKGLNNSTLHQINFINKMTSRFEQLKKIYEAENNFFKFMITNEDRRKNYVKDVLSKNENIEKKYNEQQKDALKQIKENVDKQTKKIK